MNKFDVIKKYSPKGDQPKAIQNLSDSIREGNKRQTLLGVTGSGKTFTMASIVEQVQKPALVLAHNKTLAAQLAMEFKEYFPENSIEYFVSYYDYYQPEAYLPSRDLLIEKEATINDEIDKLRQSATKSLLTKKDVLVVASVSAIYGLGDPSEYINFIFEISVGKDLKMRTLIQNLIGMQYERNEYEFTRGNFRVRGDSLEIILAYEDDAVRFEFWGDTVEKIRRFNRITGEIIEEINTISIYPANHFVTKEEKLKSAMKSIQLELDEELRKLEDQGKIIEHNRLKTRTLYDLEMMELNGYCSGIENYSRHLDHRKEGTRPYTLLDYFGDDYLIFIDESHITIPQMRGMYKGDRSRKDTLVQHGFRLPSAKDNRPLKYEEFNDLANQVVYVSATPNEYELEISSNIVEQIIRPTGLLDPVIEIKPTKNQIDSLIAEIEKRISKSERTLVTTLTKKMAEELSDFLESANIKTNYLHSEIDTLDRSKILTDFRNGTYDVIVGINLLREGLDLPEVSLVAILDADKEGYLRSSSSLIQTIGRAARNISGKVIMFADRITKSMEKAIYETNRRRELQEKYNLKNNIIPKSIVKDIRDINERISQAPDKEINNFNLNDLKDNSNEDESVDNLTVAELESKMYDFADKLEFEKAAKIRDFIDKINKKNK
ncbi:MAG: excinuclease ABC subunit UvrB [Dehalococcoidia bacterium]|tara:strand:+ start:2735 stop:4723 length:1989 start_codon:yes stop_codon:yes gene_type:complete